MELDNNIVQNFLSKSSFAGLLALYFSYNKYKKKQGFLREELGNENSLNYAYGYFVASHAIGLFDFTRNDEVFNITEFNDYLARNLKIELEKRANNQQDQEIRNKWLEDIKFMEK